MTYFEPGTLVYIPDLLKFGYVAGSSFGFVKVEVKDEPGNYVLYAFAPSQLVSESEIREFHSTRWTPFKAVQPPVPEKKKAWAYPEFTIPLLSKTFIADFRPIPGLDDSIEEITFTDNSKITFYVAYSEHGEPYVAAEYQD